MRCLVFHGYLLRGTGSNIYNASLARALVALGHEVHLLCQDHAAAELPFVDAIGRWEGGALRVDRLREPVRCTVYTPDIGKVLPVYVADEYEGFEARPFEELDDAGVAHYVGANVEAVRAVARATKPDLALANHAIMGPAVLARALGGSVPYAVKIHGSALEYTVARQPERFLSYVHEGLDGASGVLVGSRHMAARLYAIAGADLATKTRLGPPGVDTAVFHRGEAGEAAGALAALVGRLEGPTSGWGSEAGAAAALGAIDAERDRVVSYVGKLIVSKGVDLLLAAWPLVAGAIEGARLVLVGFGAYRDGLARLAHALEAGDLDDARAVAALGRALEGGPDGELSYLSAFLGEVAADESYLQSARTAFGRVSFAGALAHEDLPPLLAVSEAQVVPSTFPEAFGMVAAEAAACGALPVVARHSGLAEVAAELAPALPPRLRPLMTFERGPEAVRQLAARLIAWLRLDPAEREAASRALAAEAAGRYGWDRVAARVIAAAQGRLDTLPEASGMPDSSDSLPRA